MTKFTKVSDRDIKAAAQRGMEIFDEKGGTTWGCDEEDFIAAQESFVEVFASAIEAEQEQMRIEENNDFGNCSESGKPEHSGYCIYV